MMRSNSFVQHICIIFLSLNWSSALDVDHVKLSQTTVNRAISDVPTNRLFVISGIAAPQNVRNDSIHGEKFDYAQKTTINESSQRIVNNFMSLPQQLLNYLENRYENNDAHSMAVESQRQKRTAESPDMCDTNECKCKHETKFLTVDCKFQQVSEFHSIDVFIMVFIYSSHGINRPSMCSTLRYKIYCN